MIDETRSVHCRKLYRTWNVTMFSRTKELSSSQGFLLENSHWSNNYGRKGERMPKSLGLFKSRSRAVNPHCMNVRRNGRCDFFPWIFFFCCRVTAWVIQPGLISLFDAFAWWVSDCADTTICSWSETFFLPLNSSGYCPVFDCTRINWSPVRCQSRLHPDSNRI